VTSTVTEPADEVAPPSARSRSARFVRHEWFLAAAAALVLAVLMIWILPPLIVYAVKPGHPWNGIANPVTTILGDVLDPTGQAWLLAWDGWSLKHGLTGLWDTNAFYPDHNGLAFNDSLAGYAPFGLIGTGPAAAMLRYNIVYVLSFALATAGMYALARQLGASRVAAALAGAAYTYAPWRYGHDGHLNILSSGGIVLALAMLARGHGWSLRHGYRPDRRRPGWVVAGWLVAAWQITLGFGIGLGFVYVLLLAVVLGAIGWLLAGRPPLDRRLLLADLGGGLIFAAVSGLFALPYLQVRSLVPATARSWAYIALFSPPGKGFLVAPRTSLVWGDADQAARAALGVVSNEKTLLCGFVLYALAAAGLFRSSWSLATRLFLGAGVLIGMLFALGTNGPAFVLLWKYLPGFDGSRTPGRLIIWSTILLCLLAAGFVTRLGEAGRAPVPARTAAVFLLVLVLVEGLPNVDHVTVAGQPAAMAAARGPMIVLPSDDSIDLNVMLWSTNGFPVMTNGASSIDTPGHQAIRELMKRFPDADAVARLRSIGIRSVVVLPDRVRGTPYEAVPDRPITGLGITRTEIGGGLVYTLD
jgi:succinate dehydrogenase hydrophobic anchor subunit